MATAIYRLKDGSRVPSCTTISKLAQNSGGLIQWAYQCGLNGLDINKMRDSAADAGNIGHALVEAAIKHTEPVFPTDGARDLGMKAFDAYRQWEKQSRIKWVDSELSLVSEQYRFGGTIDAIGIEEGANSYTLGDWKTGALYPEALIQIAAYGKLFEENTGHAIHGYHLCRFNRDSGDFIHAHFNDLEDAWESFVLLRQLYDNFAKLKKRL